MQGPEGLQGRGGIVGFDEASTGPSSWFTCTTWSLWDRSEIYRPVSNFAMTIRFGKKGDLGGGGFNALHTSALTLVV